MSLEKYHIKDFFIRLSFSQEGVCILIVYFGWVLKRVKSQSIWSQYIKETKMKKIVGLLIISTHASRYWFEQGSVLYESKKNHNSKFSVFA